MFVMQRKKKSAALNEMLCVRVCDENRAPIQSIENIIAANYFILHTIIGL